MELEMDCSVFVAGQALETERLSRKQIRLAVLVKLPFRLRLGTLYRHTFDFDQKPCEVIVRNETGIPEGERSSDTWSRLDENGIFQYERIFSEAIVMLPAKVSGEALENLRARTSVESGELPYLGSSEVSESARAAFNHFLLAYALGADQTYGAALLQLFRSQEWNEQTRAKVAIFLESDRQLTGPEVERVFQKYPVKRTSWKWGPCHGECDDLPLEETRRLIDAQMRRQRDYVHFEFFFEAKARMIQGDHIGGILHATAALEGAHAILVQSEFDRRIPEDAQTLSDEFLRLLGIHKALAITPYLLLSDEERPSSETLAEARRGVEYRNQVVHLLRKKGRYRYKAKTWHQITRWFKAIAEVYRSLVAASEHRLGGSPLA